MEKGKRLLFSILSLIAAVLGLLAIFTMFLSALEWQGAIAVVDRINGFEAVFGSNRLGFSFMNFLAYLLVLAGAVFSAVSFLKKGSKMFTLTATGCFLFAVILFFCFVPFTNWVRGDGKSWGLGVGPILGAICSLLAAGATAVSIVKK